MPNSTESGIAQHLGVKGGRGDAPSISRVERLSALAHSGPLRVGYVYVVRVTERKISAQLGRKPVWPPSECRGEQANAGSLLETRVTHFGRYLVCRGNGQLAKGATKAWPTKARGCGLLKSWKTDGWTGTSPVHRRAASWTRGVNAGRVGTRRHARTGAQMPARRPAASGMQAASDGRVEWGELGNHRRRGLGWTL